MRENNVSRRSDRSYLCIVAIYAIHAILLNVVFVQPKFNNVQGSVSLRTSRFVDIGAQGGTASVRQNFSEGVNTEVESERVENSMIDFSERANATKHGERREINVARDEDDDHSMKLPTRVYSQSKSGGAAIHFVSIMKTSNILEPVNRAINSARSIIARLSPAALGIISGCLVFLLTFTENDCI